MPPPLSFSYVDGRLICQKVLMRADFSVQCVRDTHQKAIFTALKYITSKVQTLCPNSSFMFHSRLLRHPLLHVFMPTTQVPKLLVCVF